MYYNVDYHRKEAEIGVTIGLREYWSRGYGTDLMRPSCATCSRPCRSTACT